MCLLGSILEEQTPEDIYSADNKSVFCANVLFNQDHPSRRSFFYFGHVAF